MMHDYPGRASVFFVSSVIFWLYVSLGFAIFSIVDLQPVDDFLVLAILPIPGVLVSFFTISILNRSFAVAHEDGLKYYAKFALIGSIGPGVLMLMLDASETYFTGPGIGWSYPLFGFGLGALNGLLCYYNSRNKDGVEDQESVSRLRLRRTGGAAAIMLVLSGVYFFGWEKYGPGTCVQRSGKDDVWIVVDHRMGNYQLRKWLGGAYNFRRDVPDEPYWGKPHTMRRGAFENVSSGFGVLECPKPLPES